MGVNSLITWAVMRAVIIETPTLSLTFCHWDNAWETRTSSSALSFMLDAGFGLCVWVLHGCLRHKFQALRLGHCSEVETRVCVLVLQWCWDATFKLCVLVIVVTLRRRFQPSRLGAALVTMLPCVWSLDSTFWWLVLSDFWTVYNYVMHMTI